MHLCLAELHLKPTSHLVETFFSYPDLRQSMPSLTWALLTSHSVLAQFKRSTWFFLLLQFYMRHIFCEKEADAASFYLHLSLVSSEIVDGSIPANPSGTGPSRPTEGLVG